MYSSSSGLIISTVKEDNVITCNNANASKIDTE